MGFRRKKQVSMLGLLKALWNLLKLVGKGILLSLKFLYRIIKFILKSIFKLILKINGKEIVDISEKKKNKKERTIKTSNGSTKKEINSVKIRSNVTEEVNPIKKGKKKHIPKKESFAKVHHLKGNFEDFEKYIESNKSTIGIILGARGKGKSALGMKMLENVHSATKRNCVAMGFDHEELPEWVSVVDNVEQIENDSIVLIDEGGVLFSSRNAMTNANKLLSELLLVARHKDLSIMFITQNSSNLELNVIRQADYMLLKPSSLMQIDFERAKIKEIYSEVMHLFEKHSENKGLTYIYSDKFKGFVSNTLPTFWNSKVSKSFA